MVTSQKQSQKGGSALGCSRWRQVAVRLHQGLPQACAARCSALLLAHHLPGVGLHQPAVASGHAQVQQLQYRLSLTTILQFKAHLGRGCVSVRLVRCSHRCCILPRRHCHIWLAAPPPGLLQQDLRQAHDLVAARPLPRVLHTQASVRNPASQEHVLPILEGQKPCHAVRPLRCHARAQRCAGGCCSTGAHLRPALYNEAAQGLRRGGVHGRPLRHDSHLHHDLQRHSKQ